jgi:aerobic carbon-monoxide dehydrogenase large subunit
VTEQITKRHVGRPILRREDQRLLMGEGQYVADIVLPRMLHVAFVRSPVAHARIKSVDVSRAAAAPGVAYALNGADLQKALPPVSDAQLSLPGKWKEGVQHKLLNPQQPLLAVDKARHVGEALAVIVAESRYAAEDAVDLVELDLEPLPAVMDPEGALKAEATLIHEQFGTNLVGEFSIGKGNAQAAIARAPHKLKRRFHHHRYAAIPMECRGDLAQYDGRTDTLTLWSSTQVVHWVRREVAGTLSMPESRVRVIAPDVGGGFGVKGHVYPEDLLISFLAKTLGRPVKWIEDRREHLMSACHSRDQIHDVEMGFDNDGRILGFSDSFLADVGAWNPIGSGPMYNTAVHLLGPYKIDNFSATSRIVTTNKVPNAPYRGAGRPEAVLVTERMMDLIAGTLGVEPAEIRRRNMVQPSEMPYRSGLIYRDGEPIVYDSGDYPAALEKALAAVGGVEAFRKRQKEARAQGRYLGLGIGCYVEGTGVGPFEGATIRIDPSGKIYLSAGACNHGQGMETIFSQIAADAWKVNPEDVMVSLGDTSVIPMGFGTVASRSTVTVSAALHHATQRLLKKVYAIAAHQLECAVEDVELREGGVGIIGVPGKTLSLQKIASAARPGWDNGRPPGVDAGLEETYYYEPPTVTWSYASHVAVVDVDIDTGRIAIEKYAIAHDCGVTVNPMLVDGQVIGGAAQGIGGALLEEFHYDADGQLLTTSFVDYLVPTAGDIPEIELIHQETPSPLNPLGVKGLGEGGAIAPPVALANAVSDALSPFKVEFNSTPLRPEQIVKAARGGNVA